MLPYPAARTGETPSFHGAFWTARRLLLSATGGLGSRRNAKKAGGQKAGEASGRAAAVTCGRSRQSEITQPAASAAGAELCRRRCPPRLDPESRRRPQCPLAGV